MQVQSILNRMENYKGFLYEQVRWSSRAGRPCGMLSMVPSVGRRSLWAITSSAIRLSTCRAGMRIARMVG
jgi:hypothetical protein